MHQERLAFSGSPLDRADHIRMDPDALASAMDMRARLLRLDGIIPELEDNTLGWGSLADAAPDAELVFLGMLDDRAHFAAVPQQGDNRPRPADPRGWQVMSILSEAELAIYGGARSLVDWHARHRFCAVCGAPTQIAKGGWQRTCGGCGAEHFPRVDPVTIMLVEYEGHLLLGRQPRFPPRSYSALAGFVEPGESIEEAVTRETLEEAGVPVGDVRYVFSQPWPFPSQLMIGCHAMATSDELAIDETELEDARWFSREDVARSINAPRGDETAPFMPPPPQAIAHQLMHWWLEQG